MIPPTPHSSCARGLTKLFLVVSLFAFIQASTGTLEITHAQSTIQAHNTYALTLFSGPDRAESIVGIIPPGSQIILEARTTDARWVLGHHSDGPERGWLEMRFLDFNVKAQIGELPTSQEVIFIAPAAGSPLYKTINLNDYPVIPFELGQAAEIFQTGQAYGRDPLTVSKVGDCLSDNQHFLSPFGWGSYSLGQYTQLQPVIDAFGETLAYDSLAAYDGLVTTAVLDPAFANPLACDPGESPLRCEYRMHNSSIAIIMFGAQDLLFTPPDQFDRNLRQIVHETIQSGVVPILSTFPGNLSMWEMSLRYNQIVVQIALDYDIPLINLWVALETLPHYGLDDDGRHLSTPITQAGDLTPENLLRGYPLRNLITLETLDVVWRDVLQNGTS